MSAGGLRQVLAVTRGDRKNLDAAVSLTCRVVGAKHRAEMAQYLRSLELRFHGEGGASPGREEVANPTLLEAPDMRRSIYFSSSVFRALGPLQAARGCLAAALVERLADRAGAAGEALRSGRVTFQVVPGDAFDLTAGSQHDVVDTLNLADYCGLANVVLLGAHLGRRIRTQSTHTVPDEVDAAEPRRALYLKGVCGLVCGSRRGQAAGG